MDADFEKLGFQMFRDADAGFRDKVAKTLRIAVDLVDSNKGLQRKWAHRSGKVKHLVNVHRHFPEFRDLITSDAVLRAVKSIYGDSPVLVTHSKISYKCVGVHQIWLPHQDEGYRFARRGRPDQNATAICVFLEDCDESNGVLQIYPGTHLLGNLRHEMVFAPEETEPQVRVKSLPQVDPVSVDGLAGDVLVFDGLTIHRSGTNRRGGYRCTFIFGVAPLSDVALSEDGARSIVLNSPAGQAVNLRRPMVQSVVKRVKDKFVRPISVALLRASNRLINWPPTVDLESANNG